MESPEKAEDSPAGAAQPADAFAPHRPVLFGIAYRMLGEVAEAEDMVQEAYLRWQREPRRGIGSAKAYLTTIVTRLCIDQLRSARRRREEYVGMWLPEPLAAADGADPAQAAELADSVTNAFLLLLETLSPDERAVFLLREVFGCGYDEVARAVDKSEDACRKMASRAREHLAQRRPRFPADPRRAGRLAEQFRRACLSGDTEGLLGLLADDATLYSDGGGKASAAGKPIRGAATVAKFFGNVMRNAPPGVEARPVTLNAEAGILIFVGGRLEQAMTFEIAEDRIRAIYVVRNPDKLRHLAGGAGGGRATGRN
jgi:RNA polymerase sigma-70 factor, ECF subfamily